MGDLQSEGLVIYNILSKTSVISKLGSNILDGKGNISKLKNLNPENIFILYGMNDVLIYKNDIDRFIKDSYANSIIPFLVEYYSKIIVVDPRYFYDNLYEIINNNNFKDILFLYNANTFFSDKYLASVLNNN